MLELGKGKPIYDFEVDPDENLSPIISILTGIDKHPDGKL
jgi:hypothetical protein